MRLPALGSPAQHDGHLSRRNFLRVTSGAAGGMLVALYVDLPAFPKHGRQAPQSKIYPADAFIHIRADGQIVITVNRLEMGQAVATALPMILAEELDADWSQIVAELAPAAEVYKDPVYGFQNTGGSATIANSFQQYRELGARTRAILVATAADRWHVAPASCRTENSVVYGPGNQSARYAELAPDAVQMPVPETVTLKDPAKFRLIGTRVRRLDARAKCDGSQKFGLDLDLPGMLVAVLARPPVFGGRVKTIDDTEARKVDGVRDVFEIPLVSGSAVAVVANRFWTAKQARARLSIEWDLTGIEHADTAELWRRYRALAATPGNVGVNRGDELALDQIPPARRIVAEYQLPYVAHTPMEPLNATVRFDGGGAEAWVPSQFPTFDQAAVGQVLGLKPENVVFHIEFAGGGFGRRQSFDSQVPREAAAIAKRLPGIPIKLVWTREDEIQGGYYRPMFLHRAEVGIGANGMPVAWKHVAVGQSYLVGSPFESFLVKNGVDFDSVGAITETRYSIPNLHLSAHHPKVNVPASQWRSVGFTHALFVLETLVDELATRAHADPIAYRLRLLKPDAHRLRAVLELLDHVSEWRRHLPRGHAAGIACTEYEGTAVGCAVQVTLENGRPRVRRATMTVHCGVAVNPLSIEAQFQGGLIFGMTQLLPQGAITLKDGRVEQRNFDGFVPPYIGDTPPTIDVHIVPSSERPTGCGEPPVPVASPAVVNALFRLTGRRYRTLPLVSVL